MEDWIEHIVDKVHEYYTEREIVLWGKYSVSEDIQRGLKRKYKLDIAFYVDSDVSKIDNKYVFSIDCLSGKAKKYYVVVPLAFYQSIKERLLEGGYEPNLDYFYFCDCILAQKSDYYEDANGNKIIGKYQGLKFAFSGFGSVIKIGDNVKFQETSFYIHSNSKVIIGDSVKFSGTSFKVSTSSEINIESNVQLSNDKILLLNSGKIDIDDDSILIEVSIVLGDNTYLGIGRGDNLFCLSMNSGKGARIILHEKVKVLADIYQRTMWLIGDSSRLEVGESSFCFSDGSSLILDGMSRLTIGRKFSIGKSYYIWIGESTEVIIGDDCLFSQNQIIRSNDGHSIFDVETGENINSTTEINRTKKL